MSLIAKATPGSVQRAEAEGLTLHPRLSEPLIEEDQMKKEIASLAFSLWEQRKSPLGSPELDWFEAERRLRGA